MKKKMRVYLPLTYDDDGHHHHQVNRQRDVRKLCNCLFDVIAYVCWLSISKTICKMQKVYVPKAKYFLCEELV